MMASVIGKVLGVLLLVFGLSSETVWARRSVRRAVNEPVRSELNLVLEAANRLHSALSHNDDELLETSIDSMLGLIEHAEVKVADSLDVRGRHILQILRSIHESLSLTREYSGTRRSEKLKAVFSDVVQIATNYQLDSYRIFFCSKDRTVWLQKSWKAQHPFDQADLKNCGAAIR
jgi:hypothetical protein